MLGELTLSVRSAAGLGAVDWKGTCDPFVRGVCHPTGPDEEGFCQPPQLTTKERDGRREDKCVRHKSAEV